MICGRDFVVADAEMWQVWILHRQSWILNRIENSFCKLYFGEVPKMAEGTPLERVQVVNSGARVQIPPSPFGPFLVRKKVWVVLSAPWQINSNATLKIQRKLSLSEQKQYNGKTRSQAVLCPESNEREKDKSLIPAWKFLPGRNDSMAWFHNARVLQKQKLAILRSGTEQNFFESLILAQDERWRRA